MGYTIGNDEVALILSPVNFNEKGEWSGHISTSIAMGPEESVLDSKIIPEVLRCVTKCLPRYSSRAPLDGRTL